MLRREKSGSITDKTEAETLGAVALCKKIVIDEKAGEKPVECTIIHTWMRSYLKTDMYKTHTACQTLGVSKT
jgi:hypothetical protein